MKIPKCVQNKPNIPRQIPIFTTVVFSPKFVAFRWMLFLKIEDVIDIMCVAEIKQQVVLDINGIGPVSLKMGNAYRIQNWDPIFHCDTLEHCEHCQPNIIKGSYPSIRPSPFFQADRHICITNVGPPRCIWWVSDKTRWPFFSLFHNFICN